MTGPAPAGARTAIHSKLSRSGATGLEERNCYLGQLRQALEFEASYHMPVAQSLVLAWEFEPNQSLAAPSRKARDDLLLPPIWGQKRATLEAHPGDEQSVAGSIPPPSDDLR